jgi:uncharacterized damage-inducible protein DinB
VATPASFITPEGLINHWQGHRRLTRRVIDAFPDEKLFTFSVGGMRPFGELAIEMLGMAVPMLEGVVTDKWNWSMPAITTKSDLLDQWDGATEQMNQLWKQIPAERFRQTMTAFGQYTGVAYDLLLYVIDNEIHHRAQGYVYLRALGISPPPFYERK